MRTALLSAILACVITTAIGMPIINWLRRMKFGQKILEIGPKWHMNKQNIPTMGGFMFIIGIAAALVVMGIAMRESISWTVYAAVFLLALAYGLIGLVDDYAKIKKKQNAGLTPIQKLLLQIVVAAVFVSLLRLVGGFTAGEGGGIAVWIPGTAGSFELPWIVYLIAAIFVLVGCNNAVNLTDGIDGLAASVTLPVAIFFAAVGAKMGNTAVVLFAGALAGSLIGFLFYNFNPAKVFMGDTGSLFLGGAVAGMAFACDMPLILILVGLIYIIETLSVMLQIASFKLRNGKRLFKMAPIHHHFEMCGWSERKIVLIFTVITCVCCLIAWQLYLPRLG